MYAMCRYHMYGNETGNLTVIAQGIASKTNQTLATLSGDTRRNSWIPYQVGRFSFTCHSTE